MIEPLDETNVVIHAQIRPNVEFYRDISLDIELEDVTLRGTFSLLDEGINFAPGNQLVHTKLVYHMSIVRDIVFRYIP